MRILVLDDDPDRHKAFSLRLEGHEVSHVFKYSEVLDALQFKGPWDLVYLDHDLADFGEPEYMEQATMYGMSRCEYTGTNVSWFIARHLDEAKRPSQVIIHSWNPSGAQRMRDLLQGAGITVYIDPFKADPDPV